jgi:hypothetical protein
MDCRMRIVEHFTWRLQFVSTLHIPTHSVANYNIYIFLGSFFWWIENFVLNSYFWNHHSLEQSKILVQCKWILNKIYSWLYFCLICVSVLTSSHPIMLLLHAPRKLKKSWKMGSLVTNPFGHLCLRILLEEFLGKSHCTINQSTHQPTNHSMILNVYKETHIEDWSP